MTRARGIGVQREHFTPAIDDRELVDQAFELGNQVRGDEHGAAAGIAVLVRANDRADELAADDRIETRRRLVEDQQLGSGQIAMMSASWVRCPFERWLVFWRGSSRNCSSSARSVPAFQFVRNDAKYASASRTVIQG